LILSRRMRETCGGARRARRVSVRRPASAPHGLAVFWFRVPPMWGLLRTSLDEARVYVARQILQNRAIIAKPRGSRKP